MSCKLRILVTLSWPIKPESALCNNLLPSIDTAEPSKLPEFKTYLLFLIELIPCVSWPYLDSTLFVSYLLICSWLEKSALEPSSVPPCTRVYAPSTLVSSWLGIAVPTLGFPWSDGSTIYPPPFIVFPYVSGRTEESGVAEGRGDILGGVWLNPCADLGCSLTLTEPVPSGVGGIITVTSGVGVAGWSLLKRDTLSISSSFDV